MAIIELTTSFTCPVCDTRRVTLPDVATGDSPVTCANCQAELGSWDEVREATGPLLSQRAGQNVKQVLRAAVPDWQTK